MYRSCSKALTKLYQLPENTNIPPHRKVSEKDIKAISKNLHRRAHQPGNALQGLDILAEKLDAVFLYVPFFLATMVISDLGNISYTPHVDPLPSEDPSSSPLMVALATPWSLDSAILNAPERGYGLDTTYRNMNENVAPMTLVITINEYDRMEPGESILVLTILRSVRSLFFTSSFRACLGKCDRTDSDVLLERAECSDHEAGASSSW